MALINSAVGDYTPAQLRDYLGIEYPPQEEEEGTQKKGGLTEAQQNTENDRIWRRGQLYQTRYQKLLEGIGLKDERANSYLNTKYLDKIGKLVNEIVEESSDGKLNKLKLAEIHRMMSDSKMLNEISKFKQIEQHKERAEKHVEKLDEENASKAMEHLGSYMSLDDQGNPIPPKDSNEWHKKYDYILGLRNKAGGDKKAESPWGNFVNFVMKNKAEQNQIVTKEDAGKNFDHFYDSQSPAMMREEEYEIIAATDKALADKIKDGTATPEEKAKGDKLFKVTYNNLRELYMGMRYEDAKKSIVQPKKKTEHDDAWFKKRADELWNPNTIRQNQQQTRTQLQLVKQLDPKNPVLRSANVQNEYIIEDGSKHTMNKGQYAVTVYNFDIRDNIRLDHTMNKKLPNGIKSIIQPVSQRAKLVNQDVTSAFVSMIENGVRTKLKFLGPSNIPVLQGYFPVRAILSSQDAVNLIKTLAHCFPTAKNVFKAFGIDIKLVQDDVAHLKDGTKLKHYYGVWTNVDSKKAAKFIKHFWNGARSNTGMGYPDDLVWNCIPYKFPPKFFELRDYQLLSDLASGKLKGSDLDKNRSINLERSVGRV